MADENVLAPTPTRSDDQILPFAAWVPIGKSNHVLDLQKRQKNLIFQIAVDILQNINFFRAFTLILLEYHQEELYIHKEEMAPMALSDSKVTNDKSCSKSCLKNYEDLKKQYDDLLVKLDDTGFKASTYKRGLSILEGQVVKYKEHEVLFSEEIALLKRSVGLEEFKQPEVNEYDPRDSSLKPTTGCDKESENSKENTDDSLEQHQMKSSLKVDKDWKEKFFYHANHVSEVEPKKVRKNNDAPIIEEWVSDDEDEVETLLWKPVKYAEMYRSQKPRGNQRNWNNQKSHQLGSDFVMNNKACFACGSFNHLIKDCKRKVQKPIWNNARRVNHHNSHRMSYPHPKRNFVPKAVLMKTGMRPVNAAKPKAAYNAVKRNRFNAVKASACWVWMPKNRVVDHVSKNISASVTLKRLDYIDAQGRFKSVMAWMDAQAQGRQECSKEKEESREECSKSRKTKKMKCLEESSQQRK
ncbi:retrotransposon ORF1 [Tanacetum coccineum]